MAPADTTIHQSHTPPQTEACLVLSQPQIQSTNVCIHTPIATASASPSSTIHCLFQTYIASSTFHCLFHTYIASSLVYQLSNTYCLGNIGKQSCTNPKRYQKIACFNCSGSVVIFNMNIYFKKLSNAQKNFMKMLMNVVQNKTIIF